MRLRKLGLKLVIQLDVAVQDLASLHRNKTGP